MRIPRTAMTTIKAAPPAGAPIEVFSRSQGGWMPGKVESVALSSGNHALVSLLHEQHALKSAWRNLNMRCECMHATAATSDVASMLQMPHARARPVA